MFRAALAVLMVAMAGMAGAQGAGTYPSRSVRIIVNSPGGNRTFSRDCLRRSWHARWANHLWSKTCKAREEAWLLNSWPRLAPMDMFFNLGDSGTLAINPALKPNLAYNPLRDFTPITALINVPTVLVLEPSVPAKTLPDFVALAKSKPGEMNYGSPGVGSIHHLMHEIFAERAGIKLQHVPFRSAGAMVGAILPGTIQAGWSGIPNIQPLIEADKLRALCLSTLTRFERRSEGAAMCRAWPSGF